MFLPVILWTDALVFALLAVLLGALLRVRRSAPLRASWRRVWRNPAALSAALVLSVFLLIGLLDTLHFRSALSAASVPVTAPAPGAASASAARYSSEVRSVLDVLLAPLASRSERTYSAPLATHAYARETIELPDGRQVREFPRLRHGGAHLVQLDDWAEDVMLRVLRGLVLALVLWFVLSWMLVIALRPQAEGGTQDRMHDGSRMSAAEFSAQVWRGQSEIPWRSLLITLGFLLALILPIGMLVPEYHVLGTDKVGQDVLLLSLKSLRTALVIGTLTTLVMLPFALLLGMMAGYFRGWVDDLIQYLYTSLHSIPGVLLIAAAVLVLQVQIETRPEWFPTTAQRADFRLLALCFILGITSWTGLCRLLRGETLKLREFDYVQAARAFGVGHWRIMRRHILPNLMHIVLIAVVMDFSGLVLAEAVLSYVGVGVDPSMNSFGTMINAARLEMGREPMVWWSLSSAFVFMFLLVLSANLFADAVRDAFDPRLHIGGRSA